MADTLSSRMFVNFLGIPGILLLVYLGGPWFIGFVTVVSLIALYEFYRLVGNKNASPHVWIGILAGALLLLFHYGNICPEIVMVNWHHILIVLILIIIFLELFSGKDNATANITYTITGILYIPLLLGTMVSLRDIDSSGAETGYNLVVVLFVSVWSCDSAAYVFGKKWGKSKILERVSPKKTWVGGIAGLITAIGVVILFQQTHFFPANTISVYHAASIGTLVGIFGQAGDFVESMIKRDAGAKDSGAFLPGHGGVLDRFDSLIVATPLVYLYYLYVVVDCCTA